MLVFLIKFTSLYTHSWHFLFYSFCPFLWLSFRNPLTLFFSFRLTYQSPFIWLQTCSYFILTMLLISINLGHYSQNSSNYQLFHKTRHQSHSRSSFFIWCFTNLIIYHLVRIRSSFFKYIKLSKNCMSHSKIFGCDKVHSAAPLSLSISWTSCCLGLVHPPSQLGTETD
jgi:hypothetical protein